MDSTNHEMKIWGENFLESFKNKNMNFLHASSCLFIYFIEVYLTYSFVLLSGVEQSDLVIYEYTYILFFIFLSIISYWLYFPVL